MSSGAGHGSSTKDNSKLISVEGQAKWWPADKQARRSALPMNDFFGERGTTNSGISLTFDLTEFEMKHWASALSMISRVRLSSASPPTVI